MEESVTIAVCLRGTSRDVLRDVTQSRGKHFHPHHRPPTRAALATDGTRRARAERIRGASFFFFLQHRMAARIPSLRCWNRADELEKGARMFSDEPARREKALFKRVVHRFLINCRVKIAKHNDASRSFFIF